MKFLQASVGSAFIAAANPHRSVHHHLIIKYIQFVSSSYCHLMIIDKIYVKLRKLQHPRNDTFCDCKNPKKTHIQIMPLKTWDIWSPKLLRKRRDFSPNPKSITWRELFKVCSRLFSADLVASRTWVQQIVVISCERGRCHSLDRETFSLKIKGSAPIARIARHFSPSFKTHSFWTFSADIWAHC